MSHATIGSPAAPKPAAVGLRTDTLADSVVILLVLALLQRIVGFTRGVLFCRWLDPEQLGTWDLAFDFVALAAPVVVLGLPGSFGRYVEYYRHRGQLRTFLRRMTVVSGVLVVVAFAVVMSVPGWFSNLIFGRRDLTDLIVLWAFCLGAVIAYNFVTELFTALRLTRVAASLQFVNSVAFAVLGLGLLQAWKTEASSVLMAYGAACLVAVAAAAYFLHRSWASIPPADDVLPQRALWGKVVPFAVWVWVTNWLSHLFCIVDRYMIVHHSGLSSDEALVQVGQYHASRVLPLLFVTIANLLGAVITPYLSNDWEAGGRAEVAAKMRMCLKLVSLGFLTAGTGVLLASGFLFGVAFQGKYDAGLAVLPWTLTYCTWFGLGSISQSYLWCAERARWGSVSLFAGLLINVALNLVLLPRYGLWGAVVATAAGNLVSLSMIQAFKVVHGCRLDGGTLLMLAMPLVFVGGVWSASVAWLLVGLAAATSNSIFNADEKSRLLQLGNQYLARARAFFNFNESAT